MEVTSI